MYVWVYMWVVLIIIYKVFSESNVITWYLLYSLYPGYIAVVPPVHSNIYVL